MPTRTATQRTLRQTKVGVILMAVVFVSAMGILTIVDVVLSRREYIGEAGAVSNLILRQAERQIEGTIAAVDQALLRLIDVLIRHPEWRSAPNKDRHTYLKQIAESLPYVGSLIVVDRLGHMIDSSFDPPIRSFSAINRPYFPFHRDRPDGGLYVGPLLIGQTTGRWTLPISRRLSDAQGEFDGIVLAGIDPKALAALINHEGISGQHTLRIFFGDGHLLTQPPGGTEAIGAYDPAMIDRWTHAQASGTDRFRSIDPKTRRIEHHTLRAVANKALWADVAFVQDEVLTEWRKEFAFHGFILAIATLLAALLSLRLLREIDRGAITNAALTETVARFNRMEQGTTLGFWEIDFRTGARYLSPSWVKYLGLDKAPSPPAPPTLNWETAFHPDDRAMIGQKVRAMLDHDAPYVIEHRAVAADGQTVWVRVEGELERDERGVPTFLSGTVLDISQRKKLEMALLTSEARLAEAQRIAGLGHWEWQVDRDQLWWSNETYRLFGLDADAFQPTYSTFLERIHPDDRAKVADAIDRAVSSRGRFAVDHRLIRPDGVERTVSQQGLVQMDSRGKPERVIGTVLDITDRVKAERDLTHASRLTALGELAASLAHEMGQPLAAIKLSVGNGLIRLERGAQSVDDHRRLYETVDQQVQQLYETIEHVRQFSRREDTPPAPFLASSAVLTAIAMLGPQFEAARIAIDPSGIEAGSREGTVLGHAGRLQQVIINLLLNARDAILELGSGGGTIRVSCHAEPSAGQVRIAVENDGRPIPDADLQRIFEPFFTTKSAEKGTGIGLSISLGIVAGMGGRIEALNIPGGVRFEILLPLHAVAAETAAPLESQVPAQGNGRHILIVEDDPLTRTLLSEFLDFRGYRVSVAANGLQALDAIERGAIDLVLTDLSMPGMGGEELLRRLRNGESASRTPAPVCIVMTANPLPPSRIEELKGLGARHILRKPLSNNVIIGTIEASLY